MRDDYLDRRLARYDGYVSRNEIPSSSRVWTVGRPLEGRQQVLSPPELAALVDEAEVLALAPCDCRTRYRRCSNPTDTCLFLNQAARRMVEVGRARIIDRDQARAAMRLAEEHGLVRLTIHEPGQLDYVICACCPCCCHDLQFHLSYGRGDLIQKAAVVAVTDPEACLSCGLCVEACPFGARRLEDEVVVCPPGDCFGCGVCVPACPDQAITLAPRS